MEERDGGGGTVVCQREGWMYGGRFKIFAAGEWLGVASQLMYSGVEACPSRSRLPVGALLYLRSNIDLVPPTPTSRDGSHPNHQAT